MVKRTNMKLENILDKRLVELLDQYSDTQDSIGTNLLHIIQNMDNAEVIIPVLGMQGMGKSTLINGLLKENILPNDADETTCVPVEVKYGTNECAIVHFFDKESTIIVNTREELNEYVDNNYNPANEKHVSCIELFRKNEMLQNGMVIVDLPGVGSLTKENENTTKRYVENLCSAIFVIPTVPTIRNKESLFIKSLWSQFSKAIFVQNDWGETKEEILESMDFNNKVLRNIAEDLHNPYDNDIILVNAYNAISGALRNDQNLVKSSNIKALYDKIILLSSNWESERGSALATRLKLCIEFAKGIILKRLSDIGKSKEEIQSENEKRIAEFNQGTIEISDKINALKTYLREQEDEVYFIARDKSKECAKRIRAAIYNLIDKGVFDGPRLSTAFANIQEEETKDFMNEIIDVFINIKFEVESKFDEIQTIEIENEINIHSVEINSASSTKWENKFANLAKIGGAIASVLGAEAASAPIIAALGLASSTGPVGLIVAGVGFAIYGVFSLFGWGVKKIVQSDRADKAKRQISPKIDEIEKSLVDAISEKYNDFASACNKVLDSILKFRAEELNNLKKSLANVIDGEQEEILKKDLEYIINKQKEL